MQATETQTLSNLIETAFSDPNQVKKSVLQEAIQSVFAQLETGDLRVCLKQNQTWQTQAWIKKAILLYFKCHASQVINHTPNAYFDKMPLQFQNDTQSDFEQKKIRVVPPAHVRIGCYIGPHTVLMPSYINVGAYIGANSMIDIWATVGSCAQLGEQVHVSAGAVIAGILEPLQANPVIIEDHCFIGAHSSITEGVIVRKGAVISMGVHLSQSTKIYHRENKTITYGEIPEGSVVVPGTLPAPDQTHQVACAVIVKQVDQKTRDKVGINELLHH